MRNIFKYMVGMLLAGLAMAACSPEDFDGASQAGLPKLANYKPVVTVDQEKNVATFNIVDKEGKSPEGVYPIWEINVTPVVKTTVNGYQTKVITIAGNYSYTLRVGNRNGISDGSVEGTFTVNTTRYDFSKFVKSLTGNASKEWRVYSSIPKHLSCGESVKNPSGWWAAAPNDKIKEGIYDDRITFTAGAKPSEGAYNYNAGTDGLTFCNKGVTELGVTGASSDYSVPCVGVNGALSNVTYALGYDATYNCVTVTLPAKTLFPYMADNVQMNGTATFFVTDINDKTMTWVIQLPGICWQVIFINGEDPVTVFDPDKVNWCSVDSPDNIGAGFNTKGDMTFWFASSDWKQIGDPDFSYANGVYTITTKDATVAEWQGQCIIPTVSLPIEAEAYYDISCKLIASQAIDRITVKVNKDPDVKGDPNSLFIKSDVALKSGENLVRFAKTMAMDTGEKKPTSFNQAKFIIDLGGTPAGVEVKLKDIIIQKHNPK